MVRRRYPGSGSTSHARVKRLWPWPLVTVGLAVLLGLPSTAFAIFGLSGFWEPWGEPEIYQLSLTVPDLGIVVGDTRTFALTGLRFDGTSVDLTASAAWSSTTPSTAAADGGGSFTGVAAGKTTVSATYQGLTASGTLTVLAAAGSSKIGSIIGKDGATMMATTIPVDVAGATAAEGVSYFEILVSTNGFASYTSWTTVTPDSPLAYYPAPQDGQAYAFCSLAHLSNGSTEAKTPLVEASVAVPYITTRPATQVTNVDSSSQLMRVDFTGSFPRSATATWRYDVFVAVDGGSQQLIGSYYGQQTHVYYPAIADGTVHSYRFFTLGMYELHEQAKATNLDQTVSVAFPASGVLQPIGLVVEKNFVSRSFVRYLQVYFNTSANVTQLLQSGRVKLTQYALDGSGTGVAISLAGLLSVSGNQLLIDFGSSGIGGAPTATAANGYYALSLDLDGTGQNDTVYHFYRLLGDVNGDRTVDASDAAIVAAEIGITLPVIGERFVDGDADNNGAVTGSDRTAVIRAEGTSLGAGLPIDD